MLSTLLDKVAFMTGPLTGAAAHGEWTLAPIPDEVDLAAQPMLGTLFAWPGDEDVTEKMLTRAVTADGYDGVRDLMPWAERWWLGLILPTSITERNLPAVISRLHLTLGLARGVPLPAVEQPPLKGLWQGVAGAAYYQQQNPLAKCLIQAAYYGGLFDDLQGQYLRSHALEQDWLLVRNLARGWKIDEHPMRYLRSLYCPLFLTTHDWKEFFQAHSWRTARGWEWINHMVEALAQVELHQVGQLLNKNREQARCRS